MSDTLLFQGLKALDAGSWIAAPTAASIVTALHETRDGRWLQFSMVRTEEAFDAMLMALDRPDWLADERFASLETRVAHAEELTAMIRDVIRERSADEWLAAFHTLDVPVA